MDVFISETPHDELREWYFGTGRIPDDTGVIATRKGCDYTVLNPSSLGVFQDAFFPHGYRLVIFVGPPQPKRYVAELPIKARYGADYQEFVIESPELLHEALRTMMKEFYYFDFFLAPIRTTSSIPSRQEFDTSSSHGFHEVEQMALDDLAEDECIYNCEWEWRTELIVCKEKSLQRFHRICNLCMELAEADDPPSMCLLARLCRYLSRVR